MNLEEQVNAVYKRLARVRKSMRETNQMDTSRMNSCQISSIHADYLRDQVEEADCLLEIERLSMVIQARLAEKQG